MGNADFREFRLWEISTLGNSTLGNFDFGGFRRQEFSTSLRFPSLYQGASTNVGALRNAKFAEGELRHYVRTNAEKNKTKNAEHSLFFRGANYLKLKCTANDTRDFQRKNANFAAQYAAKKGSPFPCTPPKKHAHATARATAPGFCLGPTLREPVPPNCDTLFGDFFSKRSRVFSSLRFYQDAGVRKEARDRSRE